MSIGIQFKLIYLYNFHIAEVKATLTVLCQLK